MADTVYLLAGDCTTRFEGRREGHRRGDAVVLVKPDDTVLVHDRDGYQPSAWLTRPAALTWSPGPPDGTSGPDAATRVPRTLVAVDGDRRLTVRVHDCYGTMVAPVSPAGRPVGDCPDCDRTLVRARDRVTCPGCDAAFGLPAGARVLETTCDCGLPRLRVERGRPFEVCVDRACDPLDDRVVAAFDRAWDCPDCEGDLRILRRGGLIAGCERYPDCETAFALPRGTVEGTCNCGLPAFETPNGRRCLDATCGRHSG